MNRDKLSLRKQVAPPANMPRLDDPLYKEVGDVWGPCITEVPNPHAPQHGLYLYHFPMSLCSMKARWGLEEKGVKWTSKIVLIMVEEQFDPPYVRINPRCVVPTLVKDGKVTTDVENILNHLDTFFDGPRVVPTDARSKELIALGDSLPIEALTFGTYPDPDPRPQVFQRTPQNIAEKVKFLGGLVEKYKDDEFLCKAYQMARDRKVQVIKKADNMQGMQEMLRATHHALQKLESALKEGPFTSGGWVVGNDFTVLEVTWAVVLQRLEFLNLQPMVGDRDQLPLTWEFYDRAAARPSFKKAVLDFGPSTFMPKVIRIKIWRKMCSFFKKCAICQ